MKYIYPECKTVDHVEDWFGTKLEDPYVWLKKAREPEVLDFVARENAYTDSFFPQEELEAKIKELKAEALPELMSGISPWRGGYLATMRESGIASVHLTDEKLQDKGKLPLLPELENMAVFSAVPCPKDDSILAFMALKPGAPRLSIEICNVDEGKLIHEVDLVFGSTWGKADGCMYYCVTDSNAEKQTSTTALHRYNPFDGTDTVVYVDDSYAIFGKDAAAHDGSYVVVAICRDYSHSRWIAYDCHSGQVHMLSEAPVDWTYLDTLEDGHYFISLEGAPQGKIIRVTNDGVQHTVLEESPEKVLSGSFWAGDELFITYRENVNARLMALKDGRQVELPDAYGALSVTGSSANGVWLHFESFVLSGRLIHFDGKKLECVLASSDAEHPDVLVEQHFAPSCGDGTMIPYYMVRRKDAQKTGNNRVLMYGYGGYNNSKTPWYCEMVTNIRISKWVEDGGIYIHCNLRGGGEYGARWHEGGMLDQKRHCYEDFIGIAEQLIREDWTKAGRITISGCSNGGLMTAALVTMRPDLWGCVICSVPHTDMIHFAEDDRGPMYITEYGNPRESKEMFEYMRSYSPYHNVRETNYPPTYIQTGELDNNVPPYHGKKFAARMQALNRSDNPILLRVLAEGSHDRGKGEAFWRTTAEMHLFIDYTYRK